MPVYEAQKEIEVIASAGACFAVLTDYERMPEWQSRVCECRVLERDERGRGSVVEYAIDAKFRRVRYRLRHIYDEPQWIGSEYLRGDFREFGGEYRFTSRGEATQVAFSLRIDPGLRVPSAVAGMLGRVVMERSLQDFKHRVEGDSAGPQ